MARKRSMDGALSRGESTARVFDVSVRQASTNIQSFAANDMHIWVSNVTLMLHFLGLRS